MSYSTNLNSTTNINSTLNNSSDVYPTPSSSFGIIIAVSILALIIIASVVWYTCFRDGALKVKESGNNSHAGDNGHAKETTGNEIKPLKSILIQDAVPTNQTHVVASVKEKINVQAESNPVQVPATEEQITLNEFLGIQNERKSSVVQKNRASYNSKEERDIILNLKPIVTQAANAVKTSPSNVSIQSSYPSYYFEEERSGKRDDHELDTITKPSSILNNVVEEADEKGMRPSVLAGKLVEGDISPDQYFQMNSNWK